jgi:hypothetical protein
MDMTPTLKTLTLLDIAKLGVACDNHDEKFRGTRYEGTPALAAYKAAGRLIDGRPVAGDETLIRAEYEERVKKGCFTQRGQLLTYFKRQVYTSLEERNREATEAVERMRERRERKLYEELKQKYG